MNESKIRNPKRYRGLTLRSGLAGLIGVVLLCAITPYNDYHLHQTLLYGNHFPIGCLFLFTFLVLGVNTFLRRFFPSREFRQQEMLVVWVMLICGAGLASSGLMRYLAPMLVAPFYYMTESNRWGAWIRYIPDWMVPSRDPTSPVVKDFYEGVPLGHSIPWQPWVHVFFAWAVLFACVVGLSLCMAALMRRQWVERERLSFPLVHIPIEMTREPVKGILNAFFSSRMMWLGCAVVMAVRLINGLHSYYYSVPTIPLSWQIGPWFPNPPWSAINLWTITIYFSVIGIAFLLPTEVSFSLWAFFLAFRLIRVLRVSLGLPAVDPVMVDHETGWSTGGFIALSIWMIWAARRHLSGIWTDKHQDPDAKSSHEPIPLPYAALGAVVSFSGLVLWTVYAGVAPLFAIGLWACFAMILLVLTRIVAEGGMVFVQSSFFPTEVLSSVPGSQTFNTAGLPSAMIIQTAIIHDPREALMPNIMNSLKLKGEGSGRDIVVAILLAVVVGYVVSFVSFVGTSYRYGSVTMDPYGSRVGPIVFLNQINGFIANPSGFDWAAIARLATGAGFVGLLLFLRSKAIMGIPHPIGFLLPTTWALLTCWFSIFIAWALKSLTLRFGGLRLMRILLPFFLGMVVGEGIAAAIWVIVGMFTGVGTPVFLPI